MIPHFITSLLSNQFTSGGLTLMIGGAAMALLRNTPSQLFAWIESQCTVTVHILDSDPVFEWMVVWLDQQPYSKKSRRIKVSSMADFDDASIESARVLFSPAYGRHLIRYRGRIAWINREKGEPPATGSKSRSTESIHITLLGRSQQLVRQLVSDARAAAMSFRNEKTLAYVSTYGYWRKLPMYSPRRMETVIIPQRDETLLFSDIERFLSSREWYRSMGIPWRRGYLFHGIPGTGKSSLVEAIAGAFKMNLYVLNLSGPGMNDERLIDLVLSVSQRSIILFEDIDATAPSARATKKKGVRTPSPEAPEDQSGVTLSGLLNCLDGVLARDGCLVFMTTNHLEALDPAMIRPGRVDLQMEFGNATNLQLSRLHGRFYPDASVEDHEEFADGVYAAGITMAEAQCLLQGQLRDEIKEELQAAD